MSVERTTGSSKAKPKDVDTLLHENKAMKRVLSKVTLERFKAGQDIGMEAVRRGHAHVVCRLFVCVCVFGVPSTRYVCKARHHGSHRLMACRMCIKERVEVFLNFSRCLPNDVHWPCFPVAARHSRDLYCCVVVLLCCTVTLHFILPPLTFPRRSNTIAHIG